MGSTLTNLLYLQQEHHRERTFREELIGLLRSHDIDFDERYLFEETHIA